VQIEWDNLEKYSNKQLRRIITDRGQECKGCTEREHLVEQAARVKDLPVVKKQKAKEAPKKFDGAGEEFDPSKMSKEEIMAFFNKQKSKEDQQKEELLERVRYQYIERNKETFKPNLTKSHLTCHDLTLPNVLLFLCLVKGPRI